MINENQFFKPVKPERWQDSKGSIQKRQPWTMQELSSSIPFDLFSRKEPGRIEYEELLTLKYARRHNKFHETVVS